MLFTDFLWKFFHKNKKLGLMKEKALDYLGIILKIYEVFLCNPAVPDLAASILPNEVYFATADGNITFVVNLPSIL